MDHFDARARFIVVFIGIFIITLMIKAFLALDFDPVIHKLKISGNRFLNPQYIERKVLPIGGVHFSELGAPSDSFVESYKIRYIGNGTAELILKERKPDFVVATQNGYFLTSKDGIFLLKLSKNEIYHATGYKIFFDVDPTSLDKNGIINPKILSNINTIFSYPKWFRKLVLEVDLRKKTLYFIKGITVKVNDLNLGESYEHAIVKLIENSRIGSRYFVVGQNFVRLPNR